MARRRMLNERSGEEMASLAGRLLQDPGSATVAEISRIAGSVLSQFRIPVVHRRIEAVEVQLPPNVETPRLALHVQGGETIAMSIDSHSLGEFVRRCEGMSRR